MAKIKEFFRLIGLTITDWIEANWRWLAAIGAAFLAGAILF